MSKEKSIYTRLGGQGATLTYYARLYLGPDHLLQSASTGYSETYKRFYFRDIQAVVIRRTNLWLTWMAIGLLPALGVAVAALLASGGTALILWGITAGLLVLPGFNLWLGPTCVCHIRTAVQTEQIPSLKRLKKVRRVIARIRPLIQAAQSGQAPLASSPPSAGAAPDAAGQPSPAASPPTPEPAAPAPSPEAVPPGAP